jgi:hypothetical protein
MRQKNWQEAKVAVSSKFASRDDQPDVILILSEAYLRL